MSVGTLGKLGGGQHTGRQGAGQQSDDGCVAQVTADVERFGRALRCLLAIIGGESLCRRPFEDLKLLRRSGLSLALGRHPGAERLLSSSLLHPPSERAISSSMKFYLYSIFNSILNFWVSWFAYLRADSFSFSSAD